MTSPMRYKHGANEVAFSVGELVFEGFIFLVLDDGLLAATTFAQDSTTVARLKTTGFEPFSDLATGAAFSCAKSAFRNLSM
jgi:hypothetical protein